MNTIPRRQVLWKFLLLLLVFLGYFGYLALRFDVATGGIAAVLTWSFFVLCTPVADAGFLLDFPVRVLFGVRMVISEIAVWAVAIGVNLAVLFLAPGYYGTTALTRIQYEIIMTPWPYWSVVLLSGIGTFLSIRFGDELMDVIHHRDRDFFHSHHFKHEVVLFIFFVLVLVGYYQLVATIGIDALVSGG